MLNCFLSIVSSLTQELNVSAGIPYSIAECCGLLKNSSSLSSELLHSLSVISSLPLSFTILVWLNSSLLSLSTVISSSKLSDTSPDSLASPSPTEDRLLDLVSWSFIASAQESSLLTLTFSDSALPSSLCIRLPLSVLSLSECFSRFTIGIGSGRDSSVLAT